MRETCCSRAQTAAQAEALSALEERLHAAEEAREDALRKAASTAAELEEKSLCSDTPAARTRAYDAMLAAKDRARDAEAAAEAANAAAEDAVRKQQRLAAKVAVAEAELGLLTAEKALLQTKLTVAEETAIAAAAACGGALPERAEALRRAAAEDGRRAAAAVERARAVVTESVHRADAAFSATAPRTASCRLGTPQTRAAARRCGRSRAGPSDADASRWATSWARCCCGCSGACASSLCWPP